MSWKAFARFEPMWAGHSLVLIKEDHASRSFVCSFEMQYLDRHGHISEQDQRLLPPEETEGFLRAVMDAAWDLGIRPTGFSDHTNELTAVRYHLEDMRKLALTPASPIETEKSE